MKALYIVQVKRSTEYKSLVTSESKGFALAVYKQLQDKTKRVIAITDTGKVIHAIGTM